MLDRRHFAQKQAEPQHDEPKAHSRQPSAYPGQQRALRRQARVGVDNWRRRGVGRHGCILSFDHAEMSMDSQSELSVTKLNRRIQSLPYSRPTSRHFVIANSLDGG